jgi:hypothetical protein
MKILLINANTFKTPPCMPIGLEHAVSAIERAGHKARVLDMWHYDSPLEEMARVLREEHFDWAGVSFRNLDTAHAGRYLNFVFEAHMIVRDLQRAGARVILGGSGFSAMPAEILRYTGADFGVLGPADVALPQLLDGLEANAEAMLSGPLESRIIDGFRAGIDPDFAPARAEFINYKPYIEKGSIVGFATQFGCECGCIYCVEAGTRRLARRPAAVAAELRALRAKGFDHYHLCDSEFNHDAAHCLGVLAELERAKLDMRWTLYMKPVPCSDEMLDGLRRTGAYLITLSVDSAIACARGGAYGWDDVAAFVRGCRGRGIMLAIDLTVGLPDEPPENARRAVEFFRAKRPDKVNVNSWLRVYGGTRLERLIRERPDLHEFLTDPLPPGPPLERLFFNQLPLPEIKMLIGDDPLFKVEGFDPGTSYEVLKKV